MAVPWSFSRQGKVNHTHSVPIKHMLPKINTNQLTGMPCNVETNTPIRIRKNPMMLLLIET